MSGRNAWKALPRKPRIHIEAPIELYGSGRKTEIPFLMGVLADLSGKSDKAKLDVTKRNFDFIDVDNFDAKMKAIAPKVTFQVPNKLGGGGNLPVSIAFEKMDDFSPAAVARNVKVLNELLKARTQLKNLAANMDVNEELGVLLANLLKDKAMLQALAPEKKPAEEAKQS